MRADVGLWRSTRGDTHPHIGIEVERDWWPQATHVVWEAPLLVTCATGAGGGSQQAMFKRALDPVLAGALERWLQTLVESPAAMLERWFDEIQAGFDALAEPAWANELQAGAIALLARDDGAALAQTGLERAWRWRDGSLAQLTRDYSLAVTMTEGEGDAEYQFPRMIPGSWFGKRRPDAPVGGWQVEPIEVRAGDIVVLASGVYETTLETDYISDAVAATLAVRPRVAGAQDIADRIGAMATRVGEYANPGSRIDWTIHSRLAIAVVWLG